MDTTTQTRELGPYRLDVLLGRGGMGEVYKAWDTRLDRWVAVKRLRVGDASPEAREHFRREARAAAALGHPGILQVFDVLEDDGAGADWIVMEMVDGPDLATLVKDGPLDASLVLDYGRQIAGGLAAAHTKGILHRDLKTENVMVLPSGHTKILDFGLARTLDSDSSHGDGKGRGIAGTPRAMSPEQALGRDLDARSDLFAFGVLLYELLTARSPFRGRSARETLQRVVTHRQPPVRDFDPQISPALSDLVDRLLEKERQHRPPSADAVAQALADIAAGKSSAAPESASSDAVTTVAPEARPNTTVVAQDLEPLGDAVVRTLLVSDLVDSTTLMEKLGDRTVAAIFRQHDRLARDLLADHGGLEIDKTDGFLLLFERPWKAVCYALAYHQALQQLSFETGVPVASRVGIHLGEVILLRNSDEDVARGAKPLEVEGLAKPTAARLMSLAEAGQTLMTRAAYDVARRSAVDQDDVKRLFGDSGRLEWLAHGPYRFKGVADDVDVFEVGVEGVAPLQAPGGSEKARKMSPEPDGRTRVRPPGVRGLTPGFGVSEGKTPPPSCTLRPWTPPDFPAEPYPVLLPYTHPDLLAGRDLDLDDLMTDLRGPVLVTGLHAPSGTGKSSLLLAGLVPRLGSAGKPVALVRHPREAGVASRLLGDLLDDVPTVADDDWPGFAERLAEVERLAGTPPVLVLDQFEDVLQPEEEAARRTLGLLLAATARQRPGHGGPVCRWLLAYRKEYHGAVVAWLGDVLRDAGEAVPLGLPHDLSGPERFQDFALAPLGTPSAGGDADEIREVFQAAIERPFELRQDSGEPRYAWRFAPDHAARLARSFADARRRRPDAPLTPELQVVLAHLLAHAGEDGVLTLPDEPGSLVDEALEVHLRRALESAFPDGSRTDRSRALLALRELATARGRRDEGLPVEALARAVGAGGEEILARLATPLTRLIVPWSSSDGPRYVLAHDRMAEVVVRVVEEEGQHGGLLVDAELLALRRFVALKTALHRSRQANATRVPRRHYRRIGAHADALLWDDERRGWWTACRRRRRSDLGRAVAFTVTALVLLVLLTWGAWDRARHRQERLDLLDQVAEGLPEVALAAVHKLLARGDTEPDELLSALRQTEVAMDVLERGLGAIEDKERSALILEVVKLALPWVEETPEDPELIANLVWALDYGPGRDPAYATQAGDLRDRVLEPLRKLRRPPSIQDDDPDWIEVPAGTFLMGSPDGEGGDDEHPQHEVTVSAFRILRHEVTNAELHQLFPDPPFSVIERNENPEWRSHYETYFTAADLPATSVSWYKAYTYAAWLGGRLPTEAEWEYAARAGCPYAYCNRDGREAALGDVGWTIENSPEVPFRDATRVIPSTVMRLEPNPWGIYDMLGSLLEWTADGYARYPTEPPLARARSDPWGPALPSRGERVVRGGCFWWKAGGSRVAFRRQFAPGAEIEFQGFRVVLPGRSEL